MLKSILLLGDYRPTLTLARTYARLGFRVLVAGKTPVGASDYSRFVAEVHDLDDVDATAFQAGLSALLRRNPEICVIVPVAESFARSLAAFAEALPRHIVVAAPDKASVDACFDKAGSYERAHRLGVPVAPFGIVHDREQLLREVPAIGYPVIVRPLSSTFRLGSEKALTIENPDDLGRLLPEWPEGHVALLLQRRVEGKRHNLYFAARAGRLLRACEARIDRTDRPDGTGLAVDGETIEPDVQRAAHLALILEDLSYTGIGCAQFLVDPADGRSWFLEINPRIAGNHAIPEAAGLELGRLAIALARGEAGDIPFVSGRAGLRFAWTYGDLSGLRHRVAAGAGTRELARAAWDVFQAAVLARVHMTWTWSDPLPTIALFARAFFGNRRSRPRQQPKARQDAFAAADTVQQLPSGTASR